MFDQKRAMTDDEAMNESANEGGHDKFELPPIGYRAKRTTFSSDVGYEDSRIDLSLRKQDSIDDISYDAVDGSSVINQAEVMFVPIASESQLESSLVLSTYKFMQYD